MIKDRKELWRYGVNGIAATAIHYSVLVINLEILRFESAGMANFVAAFFGIAASFFGSRFYVFKKIHENILKQAIKFGSLYVVIALLHGFFLWLWADMCSLDYRLGFLVATLMQMSLSYIGNKYLVFKK